MLVVVSAFVLVCICSCFVSFCFCYATVTTNPAETNARKRHDHEEREDREKGRINWMRKKKREGNEKRKLKQDRKSVSSLGLSFSINTKEILFVFVHIMGNVQISSIIEWQYSFFEFFSILRQVLKVQPYLSSEKTGWSWSCLLPFLWSRYRQTHNVHLSSFCSFSSLSFFSCSFCLFIFFFFVFCVFPTFFFFKFPCRCWFFFDFLFFSFFHLFPLFLIPFFPCSLPLSLYSHVRLSRQSVNKILDRIFLHFSLFLSPFSFSIVFSSFFSFLLLFWFSACQVLASNATRWLLISSAVTKILCTSIAVA